MAYTIWFIALTDRIEQETGRSCPIGIGIPGSLEPKSRLGKGASSTWLLGRPVERDLRAALRRDIRVENDANCLAASESVDGAGTGYHIVFAVILGSGAGAGIAINGPAHHGPNNSAGEWRHNPLPLPDLTEISDEFILPGHLKTRSFPVIPKLRRSSSKEGRV